MSLRTKTLLIVGLALVSLVVVLYLAFTRLFLDNFARLEERIVIQDIERVQNILADQLAGLDTITGEWAAWDETYTFIQGRNPGYIAAHLADTTFTALNLNVVLFIDSGGQVVFSKAFDTRAKQAASLPAGLAGQFAPGSPLLSYANPRESQAGLISLPEGPLLVAARPIVTTDYQGPIRGTMVVGRFLDEAGVERLSSLTRLTLKVYPLEPAAALPPEAQAVYPLLSQLNRVVVRPVDDKTIAGYSLLDDIYGRPAMLLQANTGRTIYEHGQVTQRYFLAALLLASLVFGAINLLLLGQLILAPLARFSADLRSIGTRGHLGGRIRVTGRDELAELARGFNNTLASLEEAHRDRRESEALYRLVVEHASEGIFLADIATRQFLETNAAFQQLLGYTAAEFSRQTLYDVVNQDPARLDASIDLILAQAPTAPGEWQCRRKDGSIVTVEVSVILVCHRGEEVLCALVRDLAGRRLAEEVHLRRITDRMLDMVSQLNPAGVFQYVSPSHQYILGYELAELLGHSLFDLIHPDDLPGARAGLEEALAARSAGKLEFRCRHASGNYIWLESVINLLYGSNDQVSGIILGSRNITERKQIEDQLRSSLAEKEVLLREIHHRVKNNLQAIIYLIDLQADYTRDTGILQFFRELQNRARAIALVHDNLYRSENLTRVNFKAYLQNLLANLVEVFGVDPQIKLQVEADAFLSIDSAIPCGLIANELVTNALKYAFPPDRAGLAGRPAETPAKIDVALRAENSHFVLQVSDNGVGLPPDLDWRTSKSLGLRLVKMLAMHQLNGDIELDNQAGTTFRIIFVEN